MVAKLGAMTVNSRSVTITAVRIGTVTITIEDRDGDNPPLTAQFSVTVVRNNARPTTNDLSQFDRDELEERLYVADGLRTDPVTVVASAGVVSSEFEDSISATDFAIVIGPEGAHGVDKAATDDLVIVKVKKTTGNRYVIDLTPKDKVLNVGVAKSQAIKIYPKDKFGATSLEAWTFTAKFNTPPSVLDDSFGTIRLTRPAGAALVAAVVPPATPPSAATIKIDDYFNFASLQRMVKAGDITETDLVSQQPATAATERAKIDDVGDTVCDVTVDTKLAVVQNLNEAGALLADANTTPTGAAVVSQHLRADSQALAAIRIDSRVSAVGTDKIILALTAAGIVPDPKDDTLAKGEGAFDITIRCTDKDATAEVTGRVVIKQGV